MFLRRARRSGREQRGHYDPAPGELENFAQNSLDCSTLNLWLEPTALQRSLAYWNEPAGEQMQADFLADLRLVAEKLDELQ